MDFSLYNFIETVDNRGLSFKFPHSNVRRVCELKYLMDWKATELHNWMLVLAKSLLKDLMKKTYYKHMCLFIDAINILWNPFTISEWKLAAKKVTFQFVFLTLKCNFK